MSTKVYISGPISNNPNYAIEFTNAKAVLTSNDYIAIDPSIPDATYNDMPKRMAWKMYMIRDIAWLYECTAIYMLKGWEHSKGARIEHWLAIRKGMTVLYA